MTLTTPHLGHVRVRDVMHTGILTTDPQVSLRVVAKLMAAQKVHAVAVADPGYARRPAGIVTVLDVVAAAVADKDRTAGQAVAGQGGNVATITADQNLETAAKALLDNHTTHLVVIDPSTGHPSGILSALDIATAYAEG